MQLSGRLFSVLLLSLFITTGVQAKRLWPASKFMIPPLSESYISMGQAREQQLNPKSIKILVWNMLKGSRKSWTSDYAKIANGNDILMLQEAYWNDHMVQGLDNLQDYLYQLGVSFLYLKDNNTPTGTVIGSKVEPVDSGFVRTRDLEPFIKTPKAMTYATYAIAGSAKELMVINIHGINFANHSAFENHIEQALDIIDSHNGPIVFAGDFNTRTKKRMAHLRGVLSHKGFTELGFRDDKRSKVFGNYLDHAFVRGLLVKDAVVLKHIKSSDHKPMRLDLYYPNK